MFNIFSLVFGLIALLLPLFTLRGELRRFVVFSIASFSSGFFALSLQFLEINLRVRAEDFTALMDTMSTLVFVAILFTGLTILVNFFTYLFLVRKTTV